MELPLTTLPDAAPKGHRRPYSPPRLQLVGDLREFTAGGSAGTQETNNCGMNMAKMC